MPTRSGPIGLPQQGRLFDELAEALGRAPPVIDADDFLKAPEAHLRALCVRLGIDFTPRMLQWPAGRRDSDVVWAPHRYDAVSKSNGFEPWRERRTQLQGQPFDVATRCSGEYERLRAHSLRV